MPAKTVDYNIEMYVCGRFGFGIVLSILACPACRVGAQEIGSADKFSVITAPASTVSFEQVRLANELLHSELENFVCTEKIERYKGRVTARTGAHIDTVTAKLSFENGEEHYSEIRQNGRLLLKMADLPGAWSESEFGTLLRQTQLLLGSKAVEPGTEASLDGVPTTAYRFEVSEAESPWDLEVESQHYHIPFRTDVWIAKSSGQILYIERTSTAIPLNTKISEIRWKVRLEPMELNGRRWLVPKSGEYAVSYAQVDRREWNVLSFSDYHRYGSEVALSFAAK